MQLEITSDTVAIAVGAITIAGAIVHMTARLARIELKVTTLWETYLRRGISEGMRRGFISLNEEEET